MAKARFVIKNFVMLLRLVEECAAESWGGRCCASQTAHSKATEVHSRLSHCEGTVHFNKICQCWGFLVFK